MVLLLSEHPHIIIPRLKLEIPIAGKRGASQNIFNYK